MLLRKSLPVDKFILENNLKSKLVRKNKVNDLDEFMVSVELVGSGTFFIIMEFEIKDGE